ncbi:MAG: DUF3352 domain-containing protein [Thermomicrobiales bacterium]
MKTHTGPHNRSRSSKVLAIAVVLGLLSSTFSLLVATSASAAQEGEFGTASVTPETALAYVRGNLVPESDQWVLVDELIVRSGLPEAAGQDITVDMLFEEDPYAIGEYAFVLSSFDASEFVDMEAISGAAEDPTSLASDVPSGFSVVIQPDDIDAMSAELLETIDDDGAEVETSEYGGVTISYAPPIDEFSDGYAYAQVNEETLVIATIPEDIEPIIDTANGDIAPITENPKFTDLQGSLTTDSIVFGFVDGAAIVEQLVATVPEENLAMIPDDLIAQASATVGFSFFAAQEGLRFDSLIVPGENAEPMELTTFDPTLDERVSADSLVFATGTDIGPSGALDSLALLFASALVADPSGATPEPVTDPEAYSEEVFAQAEDVIGFNIQTDLIDQLVGEFATSLSITDIESGVPQIDAVFVSGVNDPTTVNDVLAQISFIAASAAPEDSLTSRDLEDGTSLYQINVGDETFPLIIEFGVIEDQLVIGINNGIDAYVEGPAEPLADAENYQTVFASLPTDVTGAAFINIPAIIPIVESFASSMGSSTPDADPACAEYDTQEDAQEAYEEDFNFDLDLDFDGEACEDYFAPAASPAATESIELNILGIGMVSYDVDGSMGQSTLIAIGE